MTKDEILSKMLPTTKYVELEPCDKCGSVLYYERADGSRKHNGCIGCALLKENSANANSLPVKSSMVDENGVQIYEGRACKTCGSKTRIGINAYSSKAGKCLNCAIQYHNEKQQGMQALKFSKQSKSRSNKFIVGSIERSGTVEVAPRNLIEYLELRDLVERKDLMNAREQSLESGLHWEICHQFPASGGGTDYRGKATIDNLVIALFEQNRQDGDKLPDQWSIKQVVKIGDYREAMSSREAAQLWKERKEDVFGKLTKERKADIENNEKSADEHHKKLVRKITQGVSDTIGMIDALPITQFESYFKNVKYECQKVNHRMDKIIDASIQRNEKRAYIDIKGQRVLLDAFYDGKLRSNIVMQTLQQIADAEMIITQRGELSPETIEQLNTIKRCAVIWGMDILQNPKQAIIGFTHPLLNVVSNEYVWGTLPDEYGKQWLCVWKNPTLETVRDSTLTPFDFNNEPPAEVNPIYWQEETAPIKNWCVDGWKFTDADYFYECEQERQRKAAAAERRAAAEAEKRAVRDDLINQAWSDVDEVKKQGFSVADILEEYARNHLMEFKQDTAFERTGKLRAKVDGKELDLIEITRDESKTNEKLEAELKIWRCRPMDNGYLYFRDLMY